MMKTMFHLSLSLAAAGLAALPAAAQPRNCAPRETVVQRLAEKYGESRQALGLVPQGMVMETFASAETGTWTITVTTPAGMTCLVASGQSYEAVAEALPNADTGA